MRKCLNSIILLAAFFFSNNTVTANENTLKVLDKDLPQEILLAGTRQTNEKPKLRVLDFWASWCSPCREALPAYDKLQKKFAEGVLFIAINEDDEVQNAHEVLKEIGIKNLMVVRDQKQKLSDQLRIASIPYLVIIKSDGQVVYTESGFSNKSPQHLKSKIQSLLQKK